MRAANTSYPYTHCDQPFCTTTPCPTSYPPYNPMVQIPCHSPCSVYDPRTPRYYYPGFVCRYAPYYCFHYRHLNLWCEHCMSRYMFPENYGHCPFPVPVHVQGSILNNSCPSSCATYCPTAPSTSCPSTCPSSCPSTCPSSCPTTFPSSHNIDT